MERFKRLVVPNLEASFELIGKITDRPTMVATGRAVYTGIIVQPVAALVDGKMFVEVASGESEARFAGEADMVKPPVVDTRKDMTATETFNAFINALKLGDQDLWQSFFARWSATQPDGEERRSTGPGGRTCAERPQSRLPSCAENDYECGI